MPRCSAQRADRHRRRARPRCRRPFARRSRRSFLRFAIAGRDAGVIVLVTRPLEQSQALAERLLARGHQALLFPLLRIEPIGDASTLLSPALEGAQAILFTSVNGVRAFTAASPRRDLPVFAVGQQTAAVAAEAGFHTVEAAGGDVASLAALVADRLRPDAGALVHGAGETTAGDLVGTLGERGYQVRRVTLYRAIAADAIAPDAATALHAGTIGAALFYSPRTAAIFAALIRAANLKATLATISALALSPAVATALTGLPWARVLTAQAPSEQALLDALELVAPGKGVGSSATSMSEPEIIPPSAPSEAAAPGPEPVPPPVPQVGERSRADGRRWIGAGLGL